MQTEPHKAQETRKEDEINISPRTVHYVFIVLIAGMLAFNQLTIGSLQAQSAMVSQSMTDHMAQMASFSQPLPVAGSGQPATQPPATQSASQPISTGTSTDLNALVAKVIPTGVPDVYGSELGISFDDPVKALGVLAKLDDGKGLADAKQNERYVKIGSMIACEYCCGAQTLVFPNGQAACGCAHSFAMRGLLKYLITKHGDWTDDQMLEEVGKIKALSFPKDTVKRASLLQENGIELTQINIGSNLYRGGKGLQASSTGGAANLPSQVGGC